MVRADGFGSDRSHPWSGRVDFGLIGRMSLTFHWFPPTNGDSRDVVGGGHGANATNSAGDRPPSVAYPSQIASAAESLGFAAARTPTGAWLTTARHAERILEHHDLGIDEFVRSGYPHLEQAYWFGEGVLPRLVARGQWRQPDARVAAHRGLEVASS